MRAVTVILLVIAGVAVLTVTNAAFTVPETKYGLIVRLGRLSEHIYSPGLHFKTPFVEDAKFLERRLLFARIKNQKVVVQDKSREPAAEDAPLEPSAQTVTLGSGQRSFLVDAFAAFKIVEPTRFYRIKRTEEAAQGTLSRLLQESLRKVFGAQPFSAVLSDERVNLMRQIRQQLNEEASAFGVEVVDVRIQRADLPEANIARTMERMKTSYEKQAKYYRAKGKAEAARIIAEAEKDVDILIAEAQKEGQITRGRGDAERNRIFAEAFGQDPEFAAFYRSMEAYREALKSDNTTVILSPDSDFFRYFDDDRGNGRR